VLCAEEGVDFLKVKKQVSGFKISIIRFYGSNFGLRSIKKPRNN